MRTSNMHALSQMRCHRDAIYFLRMRGGSPKGASFDSTRSRIRRKEVRTIRSIWRAVRQASGPVQKTSLHRKREVNDEHRCKKLTPQKALERADCRWCHVAGR